MAVTPVTYTGSGQVAASDYRYVKWVGKTKSGVAITIAMPKAICRSNPDWQFQDKNDTTPTVEFEGVYDDTALAAGTRTEPWTIQLADSSISGNNEILLGAGAFYVGAAAGSAALVGLTRGGGKFTVERTYREINADGDPGAVEGRIVQEEGRPKLSLTALQWLSKIPSLYAGIATVT